MDGQPYFFDANVFEDDLSPAGERQQEPEFTRDEIEAAQKKAFADGKAAGFKESEDGLTQKTLNILNKLERDYSVLLAAENDRMHNYQSDSAALCLSIMRKVFPAYTKQYGADEIKHALSEALSSHSVPEKIVVDIHTDLLEQVEAHIKDLEQSLHKHITLRANPSFGMDQCHVHWPDGGIICNRQKIAEQTITLIKDALAERGINSHDEESLDNPLSEDTTADEANSDAQDAIETEAGETS